MQCEVCKKKSAMIHYSQVINGKATEIHVCEECAKEKGMTIFPLPGAGGLTIGNLLSGLVQQTQDDEDVKAGHEHCVCGLTAVEFKKTGFLGCPHCYQTFKRMVGPLLRRIHGATNHVGKMPPGSHKAVGDAKLKGNLKRLREELARAIEDERFEEAAKLRDSIVSLEHPERSV